MEILQTIWNALTTENEKMVILFCSPLMFIEIYVSMRLFMAILNIEAKKKEEFIYVIVLGIIGLITAWSIPAPFNTFINILACPILVYFIFKTNILKAILSEIIPFIVFTVVGLIVTNIYIVISKMPNDVFIKIPIHKFLCSSIIYLAVYVVYKYLKHFHISIFLSNKIDERMHFVLLLNLIAGIIAICIQSYIATLYTNYMPFGLALTTILILLIYFFINMYSLSRTNKLEKATEDLEKEKLYNKTLSTLYDNIREFRHNFNNIVQALGGYISNNNIDGLKKYYKEVLNSSQSTNNLSLLNPELINNPAVYSILCSKYFKAKEFDINMNFEVLLDLQNINVKTYDLTLILGILLDNAIDAAKDSKEKQINVFIRKDNKVSRDLFIIENTYLDKNINIDRIFEKGYTSKKTEDKESHGLGLWNVRKILKKNNNLNLYTDKNNEWFKQQLEIYY